MKVWYKLDGASPSIVEVQDGAIVDDLKHAIKTVWGDRLPFAAPELKVFAAVAPYPDGDDDHHLGEEQKVEDVVANGAAASSSNPLIVKAPPTQRTPKRLKTELVDFEATTEKTNLEVDELAKKFGGLLDRKDALEDLYHGLQHLATKRGDKALNKKQVPIIGLSAPSEAGKTEFLRWVFNNCCTFSPGATPHARELLQRINEASPSGQVPLQNLLVLFASFNQMSTYIIGEGPIVETTVERLLRSFHGSITMRSGSADSWSNRRFKNFSDWDHVMHFFSEQYGPTGFIFCFDELSKVKSTVEEEYRTLMDSSLMASQSALSRGGFCAIVGSALSVYDIGEVVVQASGRTLWPIRFPQECPEMVARAAEKIRKETDVFSGSQSSLQTEAFWVDVTMKVLQSSPSVYNWSYVMNLPRTTSRVQPFMVEYMIPTSIEKDEVFLLAAQTALKRPALEGLSKEKVHAIVDKLHGHVSLQTGDRGMVRNWDQVRGTLSLPAWRMLQVHVGNGQLFSLVKNWVLVETRKFFYTYGPEETRKTWEEATMAVLELRKAMLQSLNGTPPTLRQIMDGLAVHHNVATGLLDYAASAKASANALESLPYQTTQCNQPCFYYSPIKNEKGVEGVFRGGFGTLSVFFQMKLYSSATPKNIKSWLEQAHGRAVELGYPSGNCIVQLFVTGTAEENVSKYSAEWPVNSMVFANDALENLFKPFGSGLIADIVNSLER